VREFHPLSFRNISQPVLTRVIRRTIHVHLLSIRDQDYELRFSTQRLGLLQWATPAHQSKSGLVLVARNHLWRRRKGEFRLTESAGPHPYAYWQQSCSG